MCWFRKKSETRNVVSESRVSLENKRPPLPKEGSGTSVAYTNRPVPPPPPKQSTKKDKEKMKEFLCDLVIQDLEKDPSEHLSGRAEAIIEMYKFIDTL